MHADCMEDLDQQSCAEVIERYVGVCNDALMENKDRFPFKQILGAARAHNVSCLVELIIDDTRTDYLLNIEHDEIVVRLCDGQCGEEHNREWRVKNDYLSDVISRPVIYVNNPALIDWSWMYD